MKVLVGLGNPGEKYGSNRHNVGFQVLSSLAIKMGVENWESKFESLVGKAPGILLVKPQTFMNRSGTAVGEIVNFYKVSLDDLIVIHDDLDLKLGEYKIVNGVGPKIHNGLNSIEAGLGRVDFWRVRVGIDNRVVGEARTPGEEYVLSDFTEGEKANLDKVKKEIIEELMLKMR